MRIVETGAETVLNVRQIANLLSAAANTRASIPTVPRGGPFGAIASDA